MNENNRNGKEDDTSQAKTKRTDYLRLFIVDLGLAITQIGNDFAWLGEGFGRYSLARRRAVAFALDETLVKLTVKIEDARSFLKDQIGALSIELTKRDDEASKK